MDTIKEAKVFRLKAQILMIVAPLGAIVYPFLLQGYSQGVAMLTAEGTATNPWAWPMAVFFLFAALAVPIVAMIVAMRFAEKHPQTVADLRAKQAALLAVAAPPIFTFLGVVLYMLKDPVSDKWSLALFWAMVIAMVMSAKRDVSAAAPRQSDSLKMRFAHGISALGIILLFLAMHIGNHLVGLAGPDAHTAVIKIVRLVYRAKLIEPLVAALFLFQVASGFGLIRRPTVAGGDRFRTFQIASGVYLLFFVLGHMNSVFIFARASLGVDTGWGFATGAPAGLLKDAWNIRLVPHYFYGVFGALAHIAAGTRIIMLNHGMNKTVADRWMIIGSGVGAVVALLIILAMCGMQMNVYPNVA